MTKKLLAIVLSMCMVISVFTGFSTVNAQEPETLVLFNESSYDGTYVRVSLSFRNLSSDCVMYAGIYGENNVMKQVNKFTFQADSVDNIDIKIPAKNLSETDVVKIFFFDAQNGVKPLCKNISFSPMQSRTKLNGIIIGTCKYTHLDPNEVEFDITDTYGNEDWAGTEFTTVCLKVAEGLNADKYFGITVDIYLNITSKNTYEIAEIVPDGYSEVLSLNVSNIDSVDSGSINYYPTETSTKPVRYKLDHGACYYNNYMWEQSVDDIICDHNGMIKSDADLELTLIENTGDSIYDIVIGKEYGYDIVTYVDGERSRFETDSGKLFTFDFEDTDILSDITNSDGEAITLSDIKEGDVIAWMSDNYSTNCASYSWIEVVNLGNNTVSGTVDGISGDKIRVDGTAYTDISGINFQLGDEGIFYLTLNKKIFYFKYNSNENYGYILNAASSKGFTHAYKVQMLTEDNEIVIYTIRDGIKYDGVAYNEDGQKPDETAVTIPLRNFDNAFKTNINARIVTYKLDSNGLISEINTVGYAETETTNEYNATEKKLGKYLEDNTVVFNIDVTKADYAYATNISSLIDGNEYSYYAFKNANNEYDCVIITNGECNYIKEEPTLSEEQYGYMLNAALSSTGFTNAFQVQMLTQDNEIVVYTVRDGVIYDGQRYNADGKIDGEIYFSIPLIKITNEFSSNITARLVRYKTDSNGLLAEINTSNDYYTGTDVYNEKAQSLNVSLEADSRVFNIDVAKADYAYATDTGSLIDGNEYSYYVFKNANDEYDCVIITNGELNYTDEPDVEPTLSEEQYGYILNALLSSTGFTHAYQVQMLTKDNEIIVYTLRDGVIYDGQRYNAYGKIDGENRITIPLKDINNAFRSNITSRLVRYKTDSNGLLAEINTSNDYYTGTDVYNSSTQSLNVVLEDDAVIFNIDVVSEKSASCSNINYLINNNEYSYVAFRNADGEYDCVVLTDAGSPIDYSQSVAIVSAVSTITLDDGVTNAKEVNYYTAGSAENNTIIIVDDIYASSPECGSSFSQIVPGAFMMFSDNGNGIASAYTVLGYAETATSASMPAYYLNNSAIADYVQGNYGGNQIIGGYINTWSSKNGMRILDVHADVNLVSDGMGGLTDGEILADMVIHNTYTNSYTFNNRTSNRIEIIAGDWTGTDSIDISDGEYATYFLAFLTDGDINDFITFSNRKLISYVSPSYPDTPTPPNSDVESDEEIWSEYGGVVESWEYLESEHEYESYADETKSYIYDDGCSSIDITFSDDTYTESSCDFICLYDANGKLVGKFTGAELAGRTINVVGNTVKIRLTSDGSVSGYGYKVTNLTINN